MMRRILQVVSLLALVFALLQPALAQEAPPEQPEEQASGEEKQPAEARKMRREKKGSARLVPVYIPPVRGAAKVRVGAATRGDRHEFPALASLAPDHVALTTKAQPTLFWFLSAATDTRIDIALIDDRSVEPLLEFTVPAGVEPGVHALRLGDHGISLEKGRVYQWFVALVPNPERRSNDVISSGAVERVDPDPELTRSLASALAKDAWREFASQGVWYDAIAAISEQISEDPGNRALRGLRARLLEEVDLMAAASDEREARGS